MGAYLNPATASKEQWLAEHGVAVKVPPKSINELPGCLPICLVDNGSFTAAAIAYNDQELVRFLYHDDRPKRWFWAEIDKMLDPDVSSLMYYYLAYD